MLKPCAHVFIGNGFTSLHGGEAAIHLTLEPFVVGEEVIDGLLQEFVCPPVRA